MLMRIFFTLGISLIINIAYSQAENNQGIVIRTMRTLRPVKEIPLNIVIKDINDKAPASGATVSIFRPFKKDSLHFAANDSGIVVAKFPGTEDSYTVRITSVGYQDTSFILSRNGKHDVLLRRIPVEMRPVIVVGYFLVRCHRYICCCWKTGFKKDSVGTIDKNERITSFESLKISPNPSSRGSSVVMQFESFNQENSVVRIFSMNGLLVRALPVTIVKGKNQLQIAIDSRWPSGTYIFQLSYAKGGIAASGKVIIQ